MVEFLKYYFLYRTFFILYLLFFFSQLYTVDLNKVLILDLCFGTIKEVYIIDSTIHCNLIDAILLKHLSKNSDNKE